MKYTNIYQLQLIQVGGKSLGLDDKKNSQSVINDNMRDK